MRTTVQKDYGSKWVNAQYARLVSVYGCPFKNNDFTVFGIIFKNIMSMQKNGFSEDAMTRYEELSRA